MKIELVKIVPSRNSKTKYTAFFNIKGFYDEEPNRIKPLRVSFGQYGAGDYTIFPRETAEQREFADKRRSLYLIRHNKESELWETEPLSKASLSRWILWGDSPNIEENISAYKKKFNI